MAQKIVTIYTDDLTGEESKETQPHKFSMDGIEYEIDLTPASYDRFLEAMGPFIAAGRKQTSSRKSQKQTRSPEDTAAIRSWAKANGHPISDRGRVPASVREAYHKAP
ncbi:Lsr2 family protein [Streptomyces xiamenensis]|uniref:histone-like nucleoid-structuring protein Lsr2 n=1 Tax=Streptomyces xiamenensis TaxID=408015 RepID=UPI0036E6D722